MLSLTDLQRLVNPDLQPQRFSLGQHFAASGNVIQTGSQFLSTLCQPQSLGLGNCG